jgi:hypothetical protein
MINLLTSLTRSKIIGTQRQRLRATITATMASGVFVVVVSIYFYEGKRLKKPRGILRFISVRETSRNQGSHLTYNTNQATSDKLAALLSSFGPSFPMHVPGIGGIHCSCHMRMKGRHQDRQPHATTAANRHSRTHSMSEELPPNTC